MLEYALMSDIIVAAGQAIYVLGSLTLLAIWSYRTRGWWK